MKVSLLGDTTRRARTSAGQGWGRDEGQAASLRSLSPLHKNQPLPNTREHKKGPGKHSKMMGRQPKIDL